MDKQLHNLVGWEVVGSGWLVWLYLLCGFDRGDNQEGGKPECGVYE